MRAFFMHAHISFLSFRNKEIVIILIEDKLRKFYY